MQDTDARRVHEGGHIRWGANMALLLAIHRLAMDFRIPIGSRAIRKLSPAALNFRMADDPEVMATSSFHRTNVRCRLKSLLDERVGFKAAAEPRVIYPVRRRFGQVTRARLN